MKILLIAGARPNFMKIAPIVRVAGQHPEVECRIVHTGQHYDFEMSQSFFRDLEIPEPDFFLGSGSGSHAEQTARIMVAFEKVCEKEKPDWVLVVGDVNSTLACSVVAKKLMIGVAHVEAGLRSGDLAMPEEINRLVTDSITDLFFVTEQSGMDNLLKEGKDPGQVHLVGHVMIDNLFFQLEKLKSMDASEFSVAGIKPPPGEYVFLTLHRPSNVDHREIFISIARALNRIAEDHPVLFPVHPRTRKQIDLYGQEFSDNIRLLPPLGFQEALFLWKDARLVMTDSGGLQEETTALGIPCLTLRENTERPITIEMGTNKLVGSDADSIFQAYKEVLKDFPLRKAGEEKKQPVPPKWDGRAAERIWDILLAR
ncbi:MAG: non-hydrolyzing UDP-N-acetylglucosamine 2-epimerase [Desulfurivibrionaceae bacterium]